MNTETSASDAHSKTRTTSWQGPGLDPIAQAVGMISNTTLIGMYSDLLGPRVNSGADALVENLTWLIKRTQLPIGASIAGFVFMERFLAKSPSIRFREPVRPLVTVLLLGMKYSEDSVYRNATWASLIGIPVTTLNKCELEFLQYLDYALFISPGDYLAVGQQADVFEARMVAALVVQGEAVSPSPPPRKETSEPETVTSGDPDAKPFAETDGSNIASASTSAGSSLAPKPGFLRRFMGAVKSSWQAD